MDGHLIKLLAKDIPVAEFVYNIEQNPELWLENTWRQDYAIQYDKGTISPQKDTRAIMFRWAPENTIESVRDSVDIVETPNWDMFMGLHKVLAPCLKACGATQLGRVFIAELKAGGHVIPHSDYGTYADHFERFHLVLTAEPGNTFYVEDGRGYGEKCFCRPGEFFWFNHKEVHWSTNDSDKPRMHLIIDAVAPKYRRERNVPA